MKKLSYLFIVFLLSACAGTIPPAPPGAVETALPGNAGETLTIQPRHISPADHLRQETVKKMIRANLKVSSIAPAPTSASFSQLSQSSEIEKRLAKVESRVKRIGRLAEKNRARIGDVELAVRHIHHIKVKGDKLKFAPGSWEIHPEMAKYLKKMAKIYKHESACEKYEKLMAIYGHTDSSPPSEISNEELACNRANAVAEFLKKEGVKMEDVEIGPDDKENRFGPGSRSRTVRLISEVIEQ